jgi:putative IMPACT (imprinted ancient) family translation regulator
MIYVPRETNEVTYKEKRSRFIGILHPISTKEKVDILLKRCRKQHSNARHICWAYRFYDNGNFYENSSDAGEPSGTAGKPILNNLLKNNIGNCILTIIRIFGGIKLGKKGLTHA